jgi:hypothetical protein
VVVPADPPFTETETFGNGLPESSVTIPVIVFIWAKEKSGSRKNRKRRCKANKGIFIRR